jgi:hypothetical protein
VVVVAEIAAVGIEGDCPNSAAVVVDAADLPRGVYTMRYFGGALLELPLPTDPGIIFFLFFSSAATTAFIILSWSVAALANSLYDKLERCTRRSCRSMVSPARYKLAFFSSVST